jgi:hypothetical protein
MFIVDLYVNGTFQHPKFHLFNLWARVSDCFLTINGSVVVDLDINTDRLRLTKGCCTIEAINGFFIPYNLIDVFLEHILKRTNSINRHRPLLRVQR